MLTGLTDLPCLQVDGHGHWEELCVFHTQVVLLVYDMQGSLCTARGQQQDGREAITAATADDLTSTEARVGKSRGTQVIGR